MDDGSHLYLNVGTQNGAGSFSFFNGMARCEMHRQTLPGDKKRGQAEWTEINIYGKERTEKLTNINKGQWRGTIEKTGKLPSDIAANIYFALGLRSYGGFDWGNDKHLKKYEGGISGCGSMPFWSVRVGVSK